MTGRYLAVSATLVATLAAATALLVWAATHDGSPEVTLHTTFGASPAATSDPEDALSEVLARVGDAPFTPLPDRRTRELLSGFLSGVATIGPRTRPELYPNLRDRLAYLVNAHVAWALALHDTGGLAPTGAGDLLAVPVPLDGRARTLTQIEEAVADLAPDEPRLALFLNPGLADGPPLPRAALRGYALDFQIDEQAQRCGARPGFWSLDAAERRLGVSGFTEHLRGLPGDRAERMRRLLALVPPPGDLSRRIDATCGPSLDRCTLVLLPL